MANVSVGWEVEGIISAQESVAGMLQVIETKTLQDTGTFWTWLGRVGPNRNPSPVEELRQSSNIPGKSATVLIDYQTSMGRRLFPRKQP